MIDKEHELSLTRQAELLQLSRGSLYYEAKGPSERDLELMRQIDRLHLEYPFMGARMLRDMLILDGYRIGRRHVAQLMRTMSIEALYQEKSTSRRNPEHAVFPYLLQGLPIQTPNHVWSADITYIPMRRGFLYLFAVMDWASRRILAWRLSNTLTTDFCIEAVQEAIERNGCPQILNTDQGVQFTSGDFVRLIREQHHIALSMDGKGCWRDNVVIERFWKSLKYEEVYLHAYDSTSAAKAGIGKYIAFYNSRRPHSGLDGQPPDALYFTSLPAQTAA